MAIDPPSDIVLEVARAADPTRAAAVTQRLNALSAGGSASGADFAAALESTAASEPTASAPAPVQGAPNMRARLANLNATANDKATKVQTQFESVLLNNFVSEMLPKDAPEAYGQGLAGQMWRSLLAEKISNQIAASGTLGIGQRLFATHPISASASLTHSSTQAQAASRAATAQMSANDLSMSSGADVDEGGFLFAHAKPL